MITAQTDINFLNQTLIRGGELCLRSRLRTRLAGLFLGLGLAAVAISDATAQPGNEKSHEVWMIDQSNSYDSDGNETLDSGGTLYIYDGRALAKSKTAVEPEKIDLGGSIAEWVKEETGSLPVRPHYI